LVAVGPVMFVDADDPQASGMSAVHRRTSALSHGRAEGTPATYLVTIA
jgi:hypothetical protein